MIRTALSLVKKNSTNIHFYFGIQIKIGEFYLNI